MITGTVTGREAVVPLTARGPAGERSFDAIIDTGYTGTLALPSDVVADLRLSRLRQSRALLADGSEIAFDIYEATVLWDGAPRRIAVDEASPTPLIGMALLEGHELRVAVREGGRVAVEALPAA